MFGQPLREMTGSKHHLICDGRGTPLKVITTAANVNDVTQTLALVDGIPPVAGRVQFGEQDAVQLVEDPGLLPALQAPPAGLPGAEPQLQRQELSGYVVVEDVQDALQAESVRQPKAPPTCSTASGSNPSNVSAKLNPASSSSSVFQEDARIPTCSPRPHVALCFHREQDLGLLRA